MVTLADVVPTVLEWTGLKPRYPLHGRSLLPILEEPHPRGWDQVVLSHVMHEVTMYYPMRTIRERRFKLIWNLNYQLPWADAGENARPGKPWPRGNVAAQLAISNSGNVRPGSVQMFAHRSTSAEGSIVQYAPCSQPSDSQIASRTLGAASSRLAAEASACAVACSTVNRCFSNRSSGTG